MIKLKLNSKWLNLFNSPRLNSRFHSFSRTHSRLIFPNVVKFYTRDDIVFESDIRKKLQQKFEERQNGGKGQKNQYSKEYSNIQFDKIENEDLRDLLKRYVEHVTEREKRRLNFNRKDRWKQRELDDIMKNFDVKQAKFKDYAKLSREANIVNLKEFKNVEEIYFYLEDLLKEGFLEKHIGMALDVFIKDVNFFKSEDMSSKNFRRFLSELSQNIISLSDDNVIYKAAKFLDWYNIEDKNCWYNLERVIVNRKDKINKSTLLKILDHFAHQNEGSMEFYDMYQYIFWSDQFKDVSNSDFISLGYNLFLTRQGYSQFFYDYYKQLLPRISAKDSTFDLLKVVQTFSEISQYYFDIFKKIEDIILSRFEQLELNEVTVIACGFAISGTGSDLFYHYMEKQIISNFTQLDKQGFREVVRALVISQNASPEFFQLIKHNIKNHLDMFNLNEKVLITKCFASTKHGDKELFSQIEKSISDLLLNINNVLLDEICIIAECLCTSKVFSREFQKLFEHVISQKIKEITINKKVCQFLYKTFYQSGMCSVGLMNILLEAMDTSKTIH